MDPQSAKNAYNQASSLFKQGKFEEALGLLDEISVHYKDPNVLKARELCQEKLRTIDDLVKPAEKHSRRWLLPSGIVAGLAMLVGGYYSVFGSNPSYVKASASKAPIASMVMMQAQAGVYDPNLINQIKPDVIQNPDYPEEPASSGLHPCTIWTPDAAAVSAYKNNTSFDISPLVAQSIPTAEIGDVVDTTAIYGYKSSTKPPRYVPNITNMGYTGETPIYPFIGQMIPGTDVQYTTPTIPAVWLVDTKDVNGDTNLETIPALTTVDFRKFASINWPRTRYMSAIIQAPGITNPDHLLMGFESAPERNITGVNYVHGDYVVQACNLHVEEGSVLVLKTTSDEDAVGSGITGKIEILFNSDQNYTISFMGTEQQPIILTSASLTPVGGDWSSFGVNSNNNYVEDYMIMEYGLTNKEIWANTTIQNNILRHNKIDSTTELAGILFRNNGQHIINNEIHNTTDAINSFPYTTNPITISNNLIYLNRKGIFTGGDYNQNIFDNIVLKCESGFNPEDGSTTKIEIYNNISTLNKVGIMLYFAPGSSQPFSNPSLYDNNAWQNFASYTIPPGVPSNIVRGNESIGHLVIHEYDSQNVSNNPNFRNIKIYDLAHDTDNDNIFSNVETGTGIYRNAQDTGTDPWNPDTDGDGLLDGVETGTGIYVSPQNTGSDPCDSDSNDNGFNDGVEVQRGHDPSAVDDFHLSSVSKHVLPGLAALMVTVGAYLLGKEKRYIFENASTSQELCIPRWEYSVREGGLTNRIKDF